MDDFDINDAFDTIILSENRLVEQGYEEGFVAGSREGEEEGYRLGAQKGSEIGQEVGFYIGFTEGIFFTFLIFFPSVVRYDRKKF